MREQNLAQMLFGTAKAFVQQINQGEKYNKLCLVYGLGIVNTTFEETTEEWFHHYRLTSVTRDLSNEC